MRTVGSLLVGLALAASLGTEAARGVRAPTRSEFRGLIRGEERLGKPSAQARRLTARVSTVSPRWARVNCCEKHVSVKQAELYYWTGRGWKLTAWVENYAELGFAHPLIGLCGIAPAAVVQDLFRNTCPPWRFTHGRHASPTEKRALLAALTNYYRDRYQSGYPRKLASPCISRLDPTWAGGIDAATKDGGDAVQVWFRRENGRWRVTYDGASGSVPSAAIVLSIEACKNGR
jgi:hypothetical protein